MKSRFDMGAVSFFLSGLSSFYLYRKTRKGIEAFTSTGVIGRAFVVFTHIVVSIHHALGAYMAMTVGKKVYLQYGTFCLVFTIFWLINARVSWILITNTIEYGIVEENDEEVYDYDYDDDDDEEEEEGQGFLSDYDFSPRIRSNA